MEIKIKNFEYGHIISHTFPGFLLLFEITLGYYLVKPFSLNDVFNGSIKPEFPILLILFIVLMILSTLLGIMLDALHHSIFKKYEQPILKFEIYKHIDNIEKLEIYRQLRDADNYYYYECYANMCLAMVPGNLLFLLWFINLKLDFVFSSTFMVLYIVINLILRKEAIRTIGEIKRIEDNLIESFSREHSNQPPGTSGAREA